MKIITKGEMRAIFLDCETGGLEPATDALCSIGAVVFDTDAADVDECILARAREAGGRW